MFSMEEWNARIDAFLETENREIGRTVPVRRIYCQDGTDRSGGGLYNETVTIDTIGRFARALGDSNPLYSDPQYAAASIRGGIVAPPLLECCICSTFIGGRVPRLRGISVFDGGTRWERFVPIRPGDVFEGRTTFLGTREITKPEQKNRLLLREHGIDLRNQRGEHVSRLTARSLIRCRAPEQEHGTEYAGPGGAQNRAEPDSSPEGKNAAGQGQPAGGGIRPGQGRPHYTEKELSGIYENLDAQLAGTMRRGDVIRYWEDVENGTVLPEEAAGPYDESDGQALMAAIGVSNAFATKWGTIRSRRGQRVTDPETGAFRLPIDRHSSDTIARVQGLPRAIVSGIHSQALLAKSVGDWMGDAGFLRSLDCSCRRPLYFGDLSIQRGRVTGKYHENGHGYVVLRMEGVRQDGVIHTEAEAVVELPRLEPGNG